MIWYIKNVHSITINVLCEEKCNIPRLVVHCMTTQIYISLFYKQVKVMTKLVLYFLFCILLLSLHRCVINIAGLIDCSIMYMCVVCGRLYRTEVCCTAACYFLFSWQTWFLIAERHFLQSLFPGFEDNPPTYAVSSSLYTLI